MQEFKELHDSGTTTLIISNEEMIGIKKNVQVLEDSNILLKGVTKTIKNKRKTKKRILEASFFGSLLSRKGTVRAGFGNINKIER